MQPTTRRRVRRLMIYVVGIYLLWAAALFAFQRQLVFAGQGRASDSQLGAAHGYERLPTQATAWLLPVETPRPLLVFAHGNAELIDDWFARLKPYHALGYAVLLVEYPGYGDAAGSPSQDSIHAALLEGIAAAQDRSDVDPGPVVLHGRSLGGGAVLTLLPETPVSAVVLESTFKDLRTMAHRFLLPAFLMRDPFDNLAALRGYHGPVLILHGRSDTLLPLHHGEALKAAAPSAQLVVRDCGHNDCAWDRTEFWPTITQFLNDAAK